MNTMRNIANFFLELPLNITKGMMVVVGYILLCLLAGGIVYLVFWLWSMAGRAL